MVFRPPPGPLVSTVGLRESATPSNGGQLILRTLHQLRQLGDIHIIFVAKLALENIATSDAPYHDVNHTIMVTLVYFTLRKEGEPVPKIKSWQ